MPVSQITMVAVDQLRPHPSNVRTHSKKQIAKIGKSIGQFGFVVPIVMDENGFILAGHGRWLAAKQRGQREVPVVTVSGLSESEARAYILADNKLTEQAGWDRPALVAELNQLGPLLTEAGLDIELTGFEAAEIDSLFDDLTDPGADPADALPALENDVVSALGDVWQLGPHTLVCGDARDVDRLKHVLGDIRAAAAFLDPPYNVRVRQVVGRGRTKHAEFAMASGELSAERFVGFLKDAMHAAAAVSRDGAVHYVCMDWRHVAELITAGRAVYGAMLNLAVWVKSNAGQGSFYRSQHEHVGVFRVGEAPHLNNVELGRHGRSRSNVWQYAGVNSFRAGRMDDLRVHPTVKPIALVSDALKDCTRRGDTILDTFCGSGTSILAAERVGRHAVGVEIEPRFVDLAIRRWQNFTRRDAILQATGQTFDEVATSHGGSRGVGRRQ